MRIFWMLFLVSLPAFAQGATTAWPDLSTECFVAGRPATQADAIRGCAAFVIRAKDGDTGTPLGIAIPQYALHIDAATGKATPVILIQAEENSGIKAVGYKVVGSGEIGAALLSEMHLLGKSKPRGPGA